MHMYRNPARRAFTLIEILIVVVILGILAAIVIPQFTDASTEASNASVRSQLQTLRGQLELYRVQHNDTYPNLILNQWDDLVDGDYIQQGPKNPLQDNSTIIADAAALGVGWVWVLATDGTGDLYAVGSNDLQFVE